MFEEAKERARQAELRAAKQALESGDADALEEAVIEGKERKQTFIDLENVIVKFYEQRGELPPEHIDIYDAKEGEQTGQRAELAPHETESEAQRIFDTITTIETPTRPMKSMQTLLLNNQEPLIEKLEDIKEQVGVNIGQIAGTLQVPETKVRAWENAGLIRSLPREDRQQRRFSLQETYLALVTSFFERNRISEDNIRNYNQMARNKFTKQKNERQEKNL
jgi:hypothetical protein